MEYWRAFHNPDYRGVVHKTIMKHPSDWYFKKDDAIWLSYLNAQKKEAPEWKAYGEEFLDKMAWMQDVTTENLGPSLWHMHPIVFLGALALNHKLWKLGTTSERYESGGRGPGVISSGYGDHGGASYGCYQLSSSLGVVQQYILQSKYKNQLLGLNIGTDVFNKEWKKIAEEDKNGFALDQHEFIKKTHYDVQLNFLAKHGINISHKRAAIHDMIWSTSVQYGPYTDLIVKATKELSFDGATDEQIIVAVQDYKYNHVESKFRSSPTHWPGLKSRASSEKTKLLLLIKDKAEVE